MLHLTDCSVFNRLYVLGNIVLAELPHFGLSKFVARFGSESGSMISAIGTCRSAKLHQFIRAKPQQLSDDGRLQNGFLECFAMRIRVANQTLTCLAYFPTIAAKGSM